MVFGVFRETVEISQPGMFDCQRVRTMGRYGFQKNHPVIFGKTIGTTTIKQDRVDRLDGSLFPYYDVLTPSYVLFCYGPRNAHGFSY